MRPQRFQFHLQTLVIVTGVLSLLLALNLRPHIQQGSFWNIIDSRQESFGWPFHVSVHYDDGCIPEIAAIGIPPEYDVFSWPALVADSAIAISLIVLTVFVSEWRLRTRRTA
jgi:hypothetical protein